MGDWDASDALRVYEVQKEVLDLGTLTTGQARWAWPTCGNSCNATRNRSASDARAGRALLQLHAASSLAQPLSRLNRAAWRDRGHLPSRTASGAWSGRTTFLFDGTIREYIAFSKPEATGLVRDLFINPGEEPPENGNGGRGEAARVVSQSGRGAS